MKTVIKNPLCWRRRSIFKKFHIFGSIIASIALLSLVSGLAPEKKTDVCQTAECTRTAAAILGRMKQEIKPCDDFYKFACGTFDDETQIPENKDSVSILSEISDKLQEQLEDIILEERPESDPNYLKLPSDFYRACNNEKAIESLGPKPMRRIARKLGWPVIDCYCWDIDDSWSWQETVIKLGRLGFNTDFIVGLIVTPSRIDRTKHIITLHQPSTSFGYQSYVNGFNGSADLAFYEYMVDMVGFFGADNKQAKTELRNSLQFEKDLTNIAFATQETDNNNGFNLHSIRDVQELHPYVNWLNYINGILPKGVTVEEDEMVNVMVPGFFEELGKLLKRTNKRTIADYLMWRALVFSSNLLSEKFRKRTLQYRTALLGEQRQVPRSKECLAMVLENFAVSVGSLYVRKHFNQQSKVDALTLVNNIRHAAAQTIEQSQWMDDVTKHAALNKVNSITAHVGYPAEILNHTILGNMFRKMKPIDPEKYFKAALRLNFIKNYYSLSNLRLPAVKKNDWTMYANPIDINAYYSASDNSIELSAGILQDPYFNSQRPNSLNYGGIGTFIGHEISHGFDTNSRRYDGEGNFADWWQPEAKNISLEKVKCLIEQYSTITDEQTGLKLDGVMTQNENIADNSGIKHAYLAYKRLVTENGEEPQLPGLDYTSLQTFWIAQGQTWCARYKTEYLKHVIKTDDHLPNKYRVLEPLKNMPEFSRDFNCAAGTPMNPVKKCEIW